MAIYLIDKKLHKLNTYILTGLDIRTHHDNKPYTIKVINVSITSKTPSSFCHLAFCVCNKKHLT